MSSTPDFRPCASPKHGPGVPGCTCDPGPDAAPSMLDHALKHAARGFAVFPLHTPRDGVCSCNDGGPCLSRSIGKHPRTQHGLNEATTDPDQIRRWWARWPDANIGWATGDASGRWVLDLDGPSAHTTLAALEKEHGPLPPTLTVRTGREGGEHRIFAMPEGVEVRNSSAKVGPKVDVRGTGGYAILPPSLHELGRRYEVATTGIAPAECPAWVFGLLAKPKVPAAQQHQHVPAPHEVMDTLLGAPDRVLVGDNGGADAARLDGIVRAACERIRKAPEGTRNDTLNRECFGVGGWLDGLGGTVDQVAPALEAAAIEAQQAPATVRRVLEDGRAASRGRPPDNNREDVTWHGGPGAPPPATPAQAPTWIETLRAGVEAGDVAGLLGSNAVLLGVQRPGVFAGEVEVLLAQLGHTNRASIRRAGKELVKAEKTQRKAHQVAELPLIVQHGKTWWVLETDRYLSVAKELAAVELGRLHSDIDTLITTENGARYMTPVEVFGAHGVTGRRLRWTYDAAGSTWDPVERVLTVPGARVRAGRAERSVAVEGWLDVFVPESQQPKLLDWLATACRLDRPTSAPQFRGPDSAGKAMLAAGLSTWLGGRMDYRDATGDFNAGLIFNPLVVLDEGIAESKPDAFRSLTGNLEHQVTEKGRMPEELRGCPRILTTSNEPDPHRLGRQELSSHSEHALGRRILVFDVQQEAADYLAFIGGWDATGDWTGPDGDLVAHLRWLAETRDVVPGKRFLVEGDAMAWVTSAHTRAGVAGDIVQAYTAYRDLELDGMTGEFSNAQPFFYYPQHPGHVGVNVGGLQTHWKRLVGDDKRPSFNKLSVPLRRMSGQEVAIRPDLGPAERGPRVYLVPVVRLSGGEDA